MDGNCGSEKCLVHDDKCGIYKSTCALHNDQCGPYKRANPAINGVFKTENLN